MNFRIFFLMGFTGLPTYLFSQGTGSTVPSQVRSLPVFAVDSLQGKTGYSSLEIGLSPSLDTTCLGYIAAQEITSVVKLMPDTSLRIWLQRFVNGSYANQFTQFGDRRLWVIEDLSVQESAAISQTL